MLHLHATVSVQPFQSGIHRPFAPRRCIRACAAEARSVSDVFRVPSGAQEAAKQAEVAVLKAYEAGVKRQQIELLLPLIGATDLDDWPGGIRQQFKAALPMVESILKAVKATTGLEGRLQAEILDQGDAVGVWYNDKILAALFPTAETLNKIQQLAEGKQLVLLINPQWQSGQVISDFGLFGRKKKEEFVQSCTKTYTLKAMRITGEDIRFLSMNGRTQLFVQEGPKSTFVQEFTDNVPSYFDLEKLLQAREGSIASMSLIERLQSEMAFNANSLKARDQNSD